MTEDIFIMSYLVPELQRELRIAKKHIKSIHDDMYPDDIRDAPNKRGMVKYAERYEFYCELARLVELLLKHLHA